LAGFGVTTEGVECFIDLGKNSDEKNLAVLRTLQQQKDAIESSFGATLDWQELEESRGCRICSVLKGGWGTPEAEWPALQERLIDAMVKLYNALKVPVQNLTI